MATIKTIFQIIALSSVMLTASCSSNIRTGQIPEQGLTVSQLYHQTLRENDTADTVRELMGNKRVALKPNYNGYVRTAQNETLALIKPLDNPTVPIFIYPHVVNLGDEELVKPGYTTQFYLFKRNHFAMKSEHYA